MRKFVALLFVLIFNISNAQFQNEENTFTESEARSYETPDERIASGGNPGGEDDVPIDDYISFLILTAIGGIIYYQRQRKILK